MAYFRSLLPHVSFGGTGATPPHMTDIFLNTSFFRQLTAKKRGNYGFKKDQKTEIDTLTYPPPPPSVIWGHRRKSPPLQSVIC